MVGFDPPSPHGSTGPMNTAQVIRQQPVKQSKGMTGVSKRAFLPEPDVSKRSQVSLMASKHTHHESSFRAAPAGHHSLPRSLPPSPLLKKC